MSETKACGRRSGHMWVLTVPGNEMDGPPYWHCGTCDSRVPVPKPPARPMSAPDRVTREREAARWPERCPICSHDFGRDAVVFDLATHVAVRHADEMKAWLAALSTQEEASAALSEQEPGIDVTGSLLRHGPGLRPDPGHSRNAAARPHPPEPRGGRPMSDTRDKAMRRARAKGAEAAMRGEEERTNPYWDEVLRMCWRNGWREATKASR